MKLHKIVNGVQVEMTPEEQDVFEASRVPPPPIPKEVITRQARHAWAASLGLTPSQADKLFGIAEAP